jgi:type I restriction enzyme S subunit
MPNLNTDIIKALPLVLPSIDEQLELSEFFGKLHNRIALLRETNATLESIAQALFKSWFIDFDPVRARQQGLMPAGMDEATADLFPDRFDESAADLLPLSWEIANLGAEASYLN